jgi:hypothetical protein
MDRIPLSPENKVYTLKPRFITSIQKYFKNLKLKRYKKKKIKESKTPHKRFYMVKFKIHVDDNHNPQVSDMEYEMLIPAQAAFFAKRMVETDVQRKLRIEFMDCEEIEGEEELDYYLVSKEKYVNKKSEK